MSPSPFFQGTTPLALRRLYFASRARARATAWCNRRSSSSRGGSSVRYSATWIPLRPRSRYSTVSRFLPAQRMSAERRFLAVLTFVAVEPAQIELHLSRVCRLELAQLELDDDETPQPTVIEE